MVWKGLALEEIGFGVLGRGNLSTTPTRFGLQGGTKVLWDYLGVEGGCKKEGLGVVKVVWHVGKCKI